MIVFQRPCLEKHCSKILAPNSTHSMISLSSTVSLKFPNLVLWVLYNPVSSSQPNQISLIAVIPSGSSQTDLPVRYPSAPCTLTFLSDHIYSVFPPPFSCLGSAFSQSMPKTHTLNEASSNQTLCYLFQMPLALALLVSWYNLKYMEFRARDYEYKSQFFH